MSLLIHLVRHGRTEWNIDHRLLGHTDLPLDQVGMEQARATAEALSAVQFDAVWSSDLRRAAQTAAVIVASRTLDVAIDRRLREIDFGDLEGRSWEDLDGATRSAMADFESFHPPGGESVAAMTARVSEFLDSLDAGTHAVVTHGGVIRMIKRLCHGDGFPANGEVAVVDWRLRRLVDHQ